MSQQDDPKGAENAPDTDLDPEALDQVSGGAFDSFFKLDNKDMLNPQPLPP
jgi:hypothetical protein